MTYRAAMKKKIAPVIPKGPVFHDEGNDEEAIEAPEENPHVPNDPESMDQSEEYINVIQVQPALPQNCAVHI